MLKRSIVDKLKKKNFTNLVVYGFGQGFNLLTPLLAVPYIVSKCGIENFGKTGVGMALSFFLVVIVDFGADIIGVKEVSVNRDDSKILANIFITTYAAKLLLTVGLLLILSLLFIYVPYFNREKSMFFLCLPILIGQFINPIWFLQGIEDFKWITVLNISTKMLYLVGIFIFIKKPADYIFVNLCWGMGMILPFSFGVLRCMKTFDLSFRSLIFSNVVKLLKEDYKFCVSQLFLSMKNYSPMLLIGFFGGFAVAGQYKIIEQIIMPIRTYLQMIFRFFYPKLCYEIFQSKSQGIAYWKKINTINLVIIFGLLTTIFIFSKQILGFFKVEQGNVDSMAVVLKYALLIPLFITGSFTFEQLLFSIGKRSIYIKVTIVTVILNFTIMFFLFQSYGLYGLITSLLITEAIVILCYGIILKTFFKPTPSENERDNS
ncbi:MAG: oligosaccharide flippase family protein [Burkholderiales bacterium]|nr:oligosaccharide flippase family protein [Flavobacterium sp.]